LLPDTSLFTERDQDIPVRGYGKKSLHSWSVGGVAQWLGRQSLAGELSLIYA